MTPLLIETGAAMDALLANLDDIKLLAVDTEFQRETTYYPQLALVQIASDNLVACIDPLAFDARPGLEKILLDESITKIFHSCSQDLEVLFYYLGTVPGPVYDTQIAHALLSEHHQIGYASLVEDELDVQLDKSQTRTNWLQRPLTDKQIKYAGDDVIYLYQLHQKLDRQLQSKGRKAWFDEESAKLPRHEQDFQLPPDKLWRRVKEASRLNRNQLAIVQSIALWREQLAQQQDKIRKRVFADETIIQLAQQPPKTIHSLTCIIERKHNISDNDRQRLFEAINRALETPVDQCPDNRYDALDNRQKTLLRTLQQMASKKAEELGISSAILCSRKDLENLILCHSETDEEPLCELFNRQNWRFRCIGEQLVNTVKNTK